MAVHELAGKPAPYTILARIPELIADYYRVRPEMEDPEQRVAFGTSGHRGSASRGSFNEDHILAVSQAICDYRSQAGTDGPLFLGKDTHALSEPAHATTLEVLAANGVTVFIAGLERYTPTPVISHAILSYNRRRRTGRADGIVLTPSHNPPEDGGFKYNPPHGGPADTEATRWIEQRANALLREGNRSVRRWNYAKALAADSTKQRDFTEEYVRELETVIDLEVIRAAGIRIGVDPMGGAGVGFWEPIRERYGLNLTVVNPEVDPTFRFMCVDRDGKIRMDCSSPYAMAGLIGLKDEFDIAFGNDPDYDRHGIVTPSGGLMNPNHYLSVAIHYLFKHRPRWPRAAQVGKTLVSSSMIDRVAQAAGRELCEVPVGFKWFVDPLLRGEMGFGGEESAGASFLRRDGQVWTTDKDGFILGLLAAEMTAVTQQDPSEHYRALESRHGSPVYERMDAAASREQKAILQALSPEMISARNLAGEPIEQCLTAAPGNGAAIGGLKVVSASGWFAARPSGTEDIYKIYAESFQGKAHLARIQQEAHAMVSEAFRAAGA